MRCRASSVCITAIVCAKPSRYLARLPWFAPRWNHCANACGSCVGSSAYPACFASSMTVCGRSTPSKCSCKRTLGRLCSNCLSSFMECDPLPAEAASGEAGETLQDNILPLNSGSHFISLTVVVVQSDASLICGRIGHHGADGERPFREHGIWLASRDSISDGNLGSVCLHHGSHHHAGSYHPVSLCACRQWHMACVRTGNSSRVACGLVHRTLCPPFGLARISLHLRFDDPAPVAERYRRMESFAGICGHGIERHRWLLPLRQLVVAGCHRPRLLGCIAGYAGDRRFDMDCLSRRKDFCTPYAVDRGRVRHGDCDRGSSVVGPPRLALGRRTTTSPRHDREWTSSGAGAGAVQFCWLRECDHAGFRGAQPAEDDSPRGHPKRHPRRSFLYDLRLCGGAGFPHRL